MNGPLMPMPVIVGAPRSGTTLLRFMLDAHPEMAIPPETGFLIAAGSLHAAADPSRRQFFEAVTAFPPEAPTWADFGISREQFWEQLQALTPFSVADGCRAFYHAYAARFAKPRWGDKTPGYCRHLRLIGQVLPEAHFVHVIRDGRDVAQSLRQTWFCPGDGIEGLAHHWVDDVTAARQQGARSAHYVEVHYEELICDSAAVLRRLCEFLDLPYTAAMLAYHRRTPERLEEHRDRYRADGTLVVSHADRVRQQALTMMPPQRSRMQAWRQQMPNDERTRFEAVAGALLEELGYG